MSTKGVHKKPQLQCFENWDFDGDIPIGKGGNAHIWKVRRKSDGAIGACKILFEHYFYSDEPEVGNRVERFRREIDLHKKYSEIEGVLPVLDSYNTNSESPKDVPWIITRFATPLSDIYLNENIDFDLTQAVRFIVQIAKTLAILQTHGVFHRDLKPDNLYEYEGMPCLGDFGLARAEGLSALTLPEERRAPVFYLAPEQLRTPYDPSSGYADVYQLAKVLWVIGVRQEYPLLGALQLDVAALCLSTYVKDSHRSKAKRIDALIACCTRHEPLERLTMQVFSKELQEWLNGVEAKDFPTMDTKLTDLFKEIDAREASRLAKLNNNMNWEQAAEQVVKATFPSRNIIAEKLKVYRSDPIEFEDFGLTWNIGFLLFGTFGLEVVFNCRSTSPGSRMYDLFAAWKYWDVRPGKQLNRGDLFVHDVVRIDVGLPSAVNSALKISEELVNQIPFVLEKLLKSPI